MAKFLDAALTRLVKDVARAEIPRAQHATTRRTRRRSTSARAGSSSRRSSSSRSRSASRS